MTTVAVSAGRQRRMMWRIGLIVAGGIGGTAGFGYAQEAKSVKPSVQKDNAIRKLQPGDVAGLPAEFVDKLNARGCTIPQFGEVGRKSEAGGKSATAGEPASEAAGGPTNVIHGEFARAAQGAWGA